MTNYRRRANYLNGLQCHKRLWYEKNYPGRATSASRSQRRLLGQSREVTEQAQCRFPEGMLIDTTDPQEAAEQTQEAINSDISCIFNASFIFHDIWWVRSDILQRDSNSWEIIEVEASADVKEEHLADLAFQKYVLTEQGVTISGTEVMYINRECVYPDLSNLFVTKDVTDKVDPLVGDVANNIEIFETTLNGNAEPEIPIGRQCDNPDRCPFKEYCWRDVPECCSIFTIPRLSWDKKNELVERDILGIRDLPHDFRLNDGERAYVNMVLNNQPEIDNEAIRRKLSELKYPIHFFDFETLNPAIPRFEGMRSYQQFPFQYSCHILQSDDSLTHHEYLHTDITDPRLPLVESLLDHISDVGSVVVYHASFERDRLKDLAQFFPGHSEALQSIISRLWDQELIFTRHYKHPEFYGSTSLKYVLPVLVPCLSYEDLDIQEGDDAQAVWDEMINTANEEARNNMINDLIAYCEMDTLATVEIHKALLLQVNELCSTDC